MSSKCWTIVCLTLTLLIFGCSESEVTNITLPSAPGTDANAAALTSRTTSGLLPAPLDIPPQFAPPSHDLPTINPVPFAGDPQLPPLPGFDGMADVPVHFPGRGNVGSPVDPKEVLGPGRDGERLRLPPEMPGFELPGFESGPGAELRRLRQPGGVPTPNKSEDVRPSTSG